MTEQIVEDIRGIAQAVTHGDENTVWKCFYSIKTDLDFDPETPKSEKDILTFLNTHLPSALKDRRLSSVSVSLKKLTSSIQSRGLNKEDWAVGA